MNKLSEKFFAVIFFFQSKCSIFLLLSIDRSEMYLIEGETISFWDMSLRGAGRPAQKAGFIVKGERPFQGAAKSCGWNHAPWSGIWEADSSHWKTGRGADCVYRTRCMYDTSKECAEKLLGLGMGCPGTGNIGPKKHFQKILCPDRRKFGKIRQKKS